MNSVAAARANARWPAMTLGRQVWFMEQRRQRRSEAGAGSISCVMMAWTFWADPASGVSFTYLTNFVQADPWHSARLDRISNLVHAAIE